MFAYIKQVDELIRKYMFHKAQEDVLTVRRSRLHALRNFNPPSDPVEVVRIVYFKDLMVYRVRGHLTVGLSFIRHSQVLQANEEGEISRQSR